MTCWRPSCADRRPARDVLVAPQDECGRVVDVHVHPVGRDRPAAAERRLAGVGVDVEAREVAGGDVHPYAVSGAGISISYTCPGTRGTGCSNDWWKRHRKKPSVRFIANPCG